MNNKDRLEMLLKVADESVAEAKFSFDRQVWSLVVRRCQESVELALSGVLAFLGIHYPKDHDQARLLFSVLQSQGIGTKEAEERIKLISIDLSRKRGPALHQEEGYDKKIAKRAIDDAGFVLIETRKLIGLIEKKFSKK